MGFVVFLFFFFTSFPNAAEMAYIIFKMKKKISVTKVQVGEHQWRGDLGEFLKSIKLDFLKTYQSNRISSLDMFERRLDRKPEFLTDPPIAYFIPTKLKEDNTDNTHAGRLIVWCQPFHSNKRPTRKTSLYHFKEIHISCLYCQHSLLVITVYEQTNI